MRYMRNCQSGVKVVLSIGFFASLELGNKSSIYTRNSMVMPVYLTYVHLLLTI